MPTRKPKNPELAAAASKRDTARVGVKVGIRRFMAWLSLEFMGFGLRKGTCSVGFNVSAWATGRIAGPRGLVSVAIWPPPGQAEAHLSLRLRHAALRPRWGRWGRAQAPTGRSIAIPGRHR